MAKEFCSCEEISMMFEQILTLLKERPAGKEPFRYAEAPAGKKRAPSEYNLFIKECATGGKKTMKECAAEYKIRKGR